ncbi:MAG: pyrimidine dimer DNA glycosylase/endonuclease V [Gammaproteobacteria bacterium]
MRIWDISPGYLNRQSLLGEHRELHGLYNILTQNKRGYSRHPETLRWVGAADALAWRHALLGAEMRLRGYVDRRPLPLQTAR